MNDRQRIWKRSLWYSTIGLVSTGVIAGALIGFFVGDMAAVIAAMLAMIAVMACAFGKSRTDEALRNLAEQPDDPHL